MITVVALTTATANRPGSSCILRAAGPSREVLDPPADACRR